MTNYTGLRLEPVSALGVNILEGGTVHWNASRQFYYPVGEHIRQFHLETNQTQFLFQERFGANSAEVIKICDTVPSPNGQFIAISEVFRPNHGILSIYDVESQVAHVRLRHDEVNKFISIAFSSDSGMIAGLGVGDSGSRVLLWKIGRQVSLAGMIPVPVNVKRISFDPQNSFILLLFAPDSIHTVQINTIDKALKELHISEISDYDNFTYVPSINGMILITSKQYLITVMNDTVVSVVDPYKENITLIQSVRNYVFIGLNSVIHMYKASPAEPYLAYIGPVEMKGRNINEFSPSPDGDLAIVLHDDSFVSLCDLSVAQKIIQQKKLSTQSEEIQFSQEEDEEIQEYLMTSSQVELEISKAVMDNSEIDSLSGLFTPLPIRYHIGPIVAIATCPRKPLLATCGGQDRTLLVWNLSKRCVIASEKLTEPVNSCSFHPSGDLLAVGTSEKLLLYSLTFDSLVLRGKWDSLSCTCVSFSNGGHLLAAGSLIIKVISTYSAKTVASLRGHNLSVKSIAWAPNDAFFVSSGIDGNVFKWSAKSWDRESQVVLPSQCLNALLCSYGNDSSNTQSQNILVATSNNTIYDLENKSERMPKRRLNMTAISMPVHFSLVSGDQRGNLQVIPYPLLPAGEENPFHIGIEVGVHTQAVHCITPSSDGQTLFTASEDSSIFIFNIVQPHQIVIAAPVALSLSRDEQSFLIEKETFDDKKETLARLREMLNIHRSNYQCLKTKLGEKQSRYIVQQKNTWQMTLCALKKQVQSLKKLKIEQEKKATDMITESDSHHFMKIRSVKELYEKKLIEQTQIAANLMKDKIRIQCEYEEKLHILTEDYKAKLSERKEGAQKQLEGQVLNNTDKERELKQVERLQKEEKLVLQHEHEIEMDIFRDQFEQKIATIQNNIEIVRTDLVSYQDAYDGNTEQKASLKAAIVRTVQEKQYLQKQQKVCAEQIQSLKNELVSRGDRVARQTNHLLNMKSKNEELQKWRTVMDHRLNELKIQVEPKSIQIVRLKDDIATNETRLRQLKQSSINDDDKLAKIESEIKFFHDEIIKVDNVAARCEATIKQFKFRVHTVYTEVEPDKWDQELDRIYTEFVTKRPLDKEDKAMIETLTEFNRHKSALSTKVIKLREKVENDQDSSANSFLKQIGKNEDLITDLQRLRAENKKLKSELRFQTTRINSLMRLVGRENKTVEAKVRTLFKSSNINITQPSSQTPTVQKRITRSGTSMTVEHFV